MINQYKVIITNRNLYREIDIPFDTTFYSIGTEIECNYRLRKELFFEDLKIDFLCNGNMWSMMCSDNVYITLGDARKLLTKQVVHGEKLIIKYQKSDNVVFELEFKIDFDSDNRKYERKIELNNLRSLKVGADRSCNIILSLSLIHI